MNEKLFIETIEGRVASLKTKIRLEGKTLNLEKLDDELIDQGLVGFFWDDEIKEEWVNEVIKRISKKQLDYPLIVRAFFNLMLWGYEKEEKLMSIWDGCVMPLNRLRTISMDEYFILATGISYLSKLSIPFDKKIVERLREKEKGFKISFFEKTKKDNKTNIKVKKGLISLVYEKNTITDLDYILLACLIIAEKMGFISEKFNQEELEKIFLFLKNNLGNVDNYDFERINPFPIILFNLIGFSRIKAVSKKLEKNLCTQESLKDRPVWYRFLPFFEFLFLVFLRGTIELFGSNNFASDILDVVYKLTISHFILVLFSIGLLGYYKIDIGIYDALNKLFNRT